MYTLIAENEKGEQLRLTQNPDYTIVSLEGFTPPTAKITTSERGLADGETFGSSKMGKRNIVITVKPETPIEQNRINLYKWFTSSRPVRLYYKNGLRNVYADGYVEYMQGSQFDNPVCFQISVICPEAYLYDVEQSIESADYETGRFEFPFAIEDEGIELSSYDRYKGFNIINESDIPIGMVIRLAAFGIIKNPKVYNRDTLENIGVDLEMKNGDVIEISTVKGNKGIWKIEDRKRNNAIDLVAKDVTWIQLKPGDNVLTYEAEMGEELMGVTIIHNNVYGGA